MDFIDLKKKARNEIGFDEPEYLKDSDDLLNIGAIELNPTQKVIFSVSSFKGKKYFDIRNWIEAESGEWAPTKKGVHLSFDKFEGFSKAVDIFAKVVELDK